MTQPKTSSDHPKVHLALPEGYWTWSREKQREWAHQAAKEMQKRILGGK